MPIDRERARHYLKEFDFSSLFIDTLGWDHYTTQHTVSVNDIAYNLSGVAEKCHFAVLTCAPLSNGSIPDYQTRLKIDRQVAKLHFEHLIVYYDHDRTTQRWQWVKRQQGKPPRYQEHEYYHTQSGEPLIQKLTGIATTLEEEECLTLTGITGRVQAVFDVDRVIKRFYDRFKTEHDTFLSFIEGLPDDEIKKWYASVMINRLMFIYFIQKKGFLDGDVDYLKHKLDQTRGSYYSTFLRPLFFEGFAKKKEERSPETNRLLGNIPYLNGGIFLPHPIEETHIDIGIRNEAFQKLFPFFDRFRWHLDERPLRNNNEINPDVLGYIFEKYINQKQMGAYYTKEDITEYISKNTIIPRIFDMAKEKCRIAFEGEHSVWNLLQQDPDRYIYDAVRKGTDLELPPEIEVGILDVSQRTEWNKPADEAYALPTEIWRETVARRQRYEEVKKKLLAGEVRDINDLITYNLDIRQFAQDVITNCEGPELLRAFRDAIEKVTVLDPTCGSGAFLFAALNILEPLYEACLERMQVFLDELDASGEKHHPEKFSDFRQLLKRIEEHPTPKYYIYKCIILNNLYGVDIMDEAIEICKLRLFLKLVAQVEDVNEIEPLPDIDFNIKAGNTLVGFAAYKDLKKTAEGNLIKEMEIQEIEKKAQDIDIWFKVFREQQEELGGYISQKDKSLLKKDLSELENKLNEWLAQEYEVNIKNVNEYKKWLQSHKPFHWFVDFHEIMNFGGFDVIIGNPPYVEYAKMKKFYKIQNFITEPCGDLFAFIVEQSTHLVNSKGRIGAIIRLSPLANPSMSTLREILLNHNMKMHISSYSASDQPSNLFEGVRDRLSIYLIKTSTKEQRLFTTNFLKWFIKERPYLFYTKIQYEEIQNSYFNFIPKIGTKTGSVIFSKIQSFNKLPCFIEKSGEYVVFYHESPVHWHKAWTYVPYYYLENIGLKKSVSIRELYFKSSKDLTTMLCVANSSLLYWFYNTVSDCRHFTFETYSRLPIGLDKIKQEYIDKLDTLSKYLMNSYENNRKRYIRVSKKTGRSEFDAYYPAKSKNIIDQIDGVLAEHYGFTDEELDFLINYDIKYRMGDEL